MSAPSNKPTPADYRTALDRAERDVIGQALKQCQLAKAAGDGLAVDSALNTLTASRDELTKLRSQLSPADLFAVKYNVDIINNHTIALVLPRNISRLELLRDAQSFCHKMYGEDAIWRHELRRLTADPHFSSHISESLRITIDGNVAGMVGKTRREQEQLLKQGGLEMASMADLAVAQVAMLAVTGKNIFAPAGALRGVGGALVVYMLGLLIEESPGEDANRETAVGARLE